jgi:glycosyltransferase involved in cell wall biosynthesis
MSSPAVAPTPSQRSPRVTVLMCVYNDERHVGEAIESVLAQTFADFELLIVDDGSTDATPRVLAEYAARDPRIHVVTQANAGTTVSANRGLALARGEYVARLDSDDVSLPDRLAIEVAYLDRHPDVALVGGGTLLMDAKGAVVGRRNIHPRNAALALRSRCIYQQSDVMFRRATVNSLGGYRTKFRNAQDYDLWLRISDVAHVAKVPEILGKWRINPGGYTLARAAEQRYESALVRRLARERRQRGADSYDMAEPYPAQQHRQPIAPAAHLVWVASVMLQDGRRAEARQALRQALALAPSTRGRLALAATYAPGWALRLVFAARDAYLNYRYVL